MEVADQPDVVVTVTDDDPSAPVIALAGNWIFPVWNRLERVSNRCWPTGRAM